MTTPTKDKTGNTDMTEDATETSFGICAYRSPTVAGFSAVLKGRFSDFLVHEVSVDGTRAELTAMHANIETDQVNDSSSKDDEQSDRKRKREDDEEEEAQGDKKPDKDTTNSDAAMPDWDGLQGELLDLLQYQEDGTGNSKQCAKEVMEFVQKEPDEAQKYISIPSSDDKQCRRDLHEWIRARLAGHALADTTEENGVRVIRVWNLHFAKEMSDYNKFDRGAKRHQRPPAKFVRFVLYKENLDTNSAIHQLQRKCGGGRGKHSFRLGFSGMKDKRGITSQFVTMPARTSVENLVKAVNPRSNDNDKAAGGGHTDSAGVAVLRIGNFTYVNDDLRLGRLQGNRFDVVLRNIVCAQDTDRSQTKTILAEAAQALGSAGFINYFGVQRFGKYCDTHLVGIAILQKDFAKAVNLIMQSKPDERENTRQARQAWQERFAKIAEDAPRKVKEAAEKECVKRIVNDFGRFMNNEVAILKSLAQHPLDYRRAINSVAKTMRMMFVHALQSHLFNHAATFRLRTLGVKVIEGDLVPDGKIDILQPGIPKVRKVTADDVAQQRYTLEDVFLPLMGNKTKDADDETAKVYARLLAEHGLTRESFDIKDRDLNCAGDYRRLIVRPTDVDYDVIEYTDPRQPLVQTDLMKLQGIQVERASPDADNALLAMRVGFTLPPSAYATIALRELMKRPTSSDYQKDLSLDS